MISRGKINWVAYGLGGAGAGFLLALVAEITGHSSWFVLLMIVCACAPPISFGVLDGAFASRVESFRQWSSLVKLGVVVAILAVVFGGEWLLDVDPRRYSFAPLFPPVIIAATMFGVRWGMATVVLCTLAADYLFALPEFSFAITEWEDAVGLAVFAVLGAFAALVLYGLEVTEENAVYPREPE